MPLNTGDRLFPYGGSPGGAGGSGNPQGGTFQPSEIASTNLTAISVREAQWSKQFQTATVIGWINADVTTIGLATSIEIDLPEAADNFLTVTGSVYTQSNMQVTIKGTAAGAAIEFIPTVSGAVSISYSIHYKTAT